MFWPRSSRLSATSFLSAVLLTVLAVSTAHAQISGERPVSTPVYAAATYFYNDAIASNGDQFLATWIRNEGIYVSRIDRDGTVLDPLGILVSSESCSCPMGAAWDGKAYVVVWEAPNEDIVAARVSTDGRVVEGQRTIISGGPILRGSPSIAANGNITIVSTGNGYYVFDHSLHRIFAGSLANASVFRIAGDAFTLLSGGEARTLDSFGRLVSISTVEGGSISCHGQDCIRVYSSRTTKHLNIAQFDPPTMRSGPPLELPTTDGQFAVTATRSGYLLATDGGLVQRLDIHGNPSGPSSCCQPAGTVTASSNGQDAVVLRHTGWKNGQLFETLTYAMAGSQTDSGSRNLALAANTQSSPAIAGSGSNYLVAWSEAHGVFAGRLSLDGAILDGRGLLVSVQRYASPSVAFHDSSYFVAASTTYEPYFPNRNDLVTITRIDPATGATLAASTTFGNEMRIVSNGSSQVAVWVNAAGSLEAAFVNADATLSFPVTLARSETPGSFYSFVANPNLAWNGEEWLVTWEEHALVCLPCPNYTSLELKSVNGVRLTADLAPIDTQPIVIRGYGIPSSSRLASDGHDFLSVWSEFWDGSVKRLHTRRISASGSLLEERTPAFAESLQDLVWDGSSYVMALRYSPGYGSYIGNLGTLRLSPSGQVLDSLVISASADDERQASLLSLGSGRVLAAYMRVAREPLYAGVTRVFVATPHPSRERAARAGTP